MNATPTPSAVERDAGVRAWRTLWQGLAVDVLAAVAVVLVVAFTAGIDWTSAYWTALGLAVAKSALTAFASYLARYVVPPARPTTSTAVGEPR